MEQCLLSVCSATREIESEIIVIDNHSSDGSKDFLSGRFPDVRFYWNQENTGFARANNQALTYASGEYILFLNPDTLVPEDCFKKCIAFIRSKNNSCALGVKMLDGSGSFLKESKRAFPSPLTSFFKLSGLASLFPHSTIFARYYLGHLDKESTHETDVLAGAFMMIPRKIISEVKGFDEAFFMYGEDIDLSYRIQKSGFKNFYFPETTIIHFKGESTKKGSLNYVKMFYKAMSIFATKHYGGSRAGFYNLLIQAGIGLRAGASAFSRFIKWIGFPVLDAILILFSFWAVKSLWALTVRPHIQYESETLWIAFPAFTILFLIASYYSGLYDNGYRQSRLNTATLLSALVLFTVYLFLPESAKFSRGVLLFSILLGYLLTSLLRVFLCSLGIISKKNNDRSPSIAVIGDEASYEQVKRILVSSGVNDLVSGRIAVSNVPEKNTLGNWGQLGLILKTGILKKIIYCQGPLSFKEIIESVQKIPVHINAAFFSEGSHSIIESQDGHTSGSYLSSGVYYRLSNPLYQRVKRLLDFSVSLLLLLLFPLHFILKRHPLPFFRNMFSVLLNKKTFIGYAAGDFGLPPVRKGVLTTTGLPGGENILPLAALKQTDQMYARYYSVFLDLGLIWKNYKRL